MTNEEAMKELDNLKWKYAEELNDAEQNYEIQRAIDLNKKYNAINKALEAVGKADKYRWHDLWNRPYDLPTEHKQYLVEYKYSDKETVYGTPIFIAEEKRWSDECSAPKLRWREIEAFEEDE